MSQEPYDILKEYYGITSQLEKPPSGKSNKGFRGHVFCKILADHISKYVRKYDIVLGPLWIKGIEWIEWDLALVRKGAKQINGLNWYSPEDIIALFECKVHGIYGSEGEIQEVLGRIKGNFDEAKRICKNLKRCFYVSLKEARPIRRGIDYYEETKKVIKDSYIFFNSRLLGDSIRMDELEEIAKKAEFKGEFKRFIEALLQL